MKYQSNTELFEAIENLKIDLNTSGCEEAAKLLSEGMSGLNGLTDGWAYLLEYLDLVKEKYGTDFNSHQIVEWEEIQKHVHKVVHRA